MWNIYGLTCFINCYLQVILKLARQMLKHVGVSLRYYKRWYNILLIAFAGDFKINYKLDLTFHWHVATGETRGS